MAELDLVLAAAEFEVGALVAVQVAFAALAGLVGFLCGRLTRRRRVWAGAALTLILATAAATCAVTLSRCEEAAQSATDRLEGRAGGQFLPPDRGHNHRAWLRRMQGWSLAVAAGTGVVGCLALAAGRRLSARPQV